MWGRDHPSAWLTNRSAPPQQAPLESQLVMPLTPAPMLFRSTLLKSLSTRAFSTSAFVNMPASRLSEYLPFDGSWGLVRVRLSRGMWGGLRSPPGERQRKKLITDEWQRRRPHDAPRQGH